MKQFIIGLCIEFIIGLCIAVPIVAVILYFGSDSSPPDRELIRAPSKAFTPIGRTIPAVIAHFGFVGQVVESYAPSDSSPDSIFHYDYLIVVEWYNHGGQYGCTMWDQYQFKVDSNGIITNSRKTNVNHSWQYR